MRLFRFAPALLASGVACAALAGAGSAQSAPPPLPPPMPPMAPPVPPTDTTVPVGAPLLLQVVGQGVQIYDCTHRDAAFRWTLRAPEAKLLDPATHAELGIHAAGPMWRWNDGSAVSGKVVVAQAATEPGSVPWLLLAASPLGEDKGFLSSVVWVRRSETHGGAAPPSGCDPAHLGKTTRVPYRALYGFYRTGTPAGRAR